MYFMPSVFASNLQQAHFASKVGGRNLPFHVKSFSCKYIYIQRETEIDLRKNIKKIIFECNYYIHFFFQLQKQMCV